MTRRENSITLSLSEGDKDALRSIAAENNCTWGDNPNISKLVEAIAQRKLLIAQNNDWSQDLISSLCQAMHSLRAFGDSERAQAMANLLLSRSEPNPSQRHEIESVIETTQKAKWRKILDRFIDEEQPFDLSYADVAMRVWSFNVFFARIIYRNGSECLECWCKEINKDSEYEEVKNNWKFRLDLIEDASITPIKGNWKSLDTIRVELLFHGAEAFSYKGHGADVSKEWQLQSLRVVREVSDPTALYQEILPYAEDAEIIAPLDVRAEFKCKLKKIFDRYE